MLFCLLCTSPQTIHITSDHKSPQKRVSIPWMMFDAEFVVTELLSFAINIAFAFMLFCCTYSTHCAVDKG